MEKEFKNEIKQFNALPEREKKLILRKHTEERADRKIDLEDLTNAEIADNDDFKTFCLEKGIEPSKRQAGKNRNDFIAWKRSKEQES